MNQSQDSNPFGRFIEFAKPHKTGYIASVVLAVRGVLLVLFHILQQRE